MDEHQHRRRAFIRANHPDLGGNPDVFIAGLADLEEQKGAPEPQPRVVAVPRRRWPGRLAERLRSRFFPRQRARRVH
jgi:hypothetical protein